MSPINGKPQPKKLKSLGGKKVSGAGKSGGCAIALITGGLLASGWLHMLATAAGWTA